MPVLPRKKKTYREFLRTAPVNPVAGRSGQERYQAYQNAYKAQHRPQGQRGGSQAGGLPTLSSLLARVGQFETPAQLEARANRMANQGIASQQAIIREEAKLMRDEARARMEAMAAAGHAAAAQNAGLFGMVGGEFNAAANEIRGLGTNLSNQMQATTAGDVLAQNAGLASVGAPGVAVGGPAGTNSIAGATQAGVEAYRGGELPGQQLGTAGQAAQFGLAGMVAAQNSRATQEATAAFTQASREADKQRLAALKELAAGRPEQASKFLLALQDAQRQQIGLASGLIQQRAGMRQAGFEQGMQKKEYGQKVKQQQFQNALTLEELALKKEGLAFDYASVDPVKSMALGYVVDKQGRPVLDGQGKRIPAKRLLQSTGGKGASMTPGQRVDLLQKAQSAADALYYGYKNVDGKRVAATEAGDFDPSDPGTYGTGGLDYQPAITRLMQMGVGRGVAKNLVDSLYQRGYGGRPVLTPQEIKALGRQLKNPAEAKRIAANIQQQIDAGGEAAAAHTLQETLEIIYRGR